MLRADDILVLQQEQFSHDKRNHCEILSLDKNDRLKHYGLHFCKYVGRLARGIEEAKPASRTITDAALVCLSAANTLHQRLAEPEARVPTARQVDPLRHSPMPLAGSRTHVKRLTTLRSSFQWREERTPTFSGG
jgi:hypothetical protein